VILAPCGFLGEPDQVRAGDVVMMADFRPAHPAKEALRIVRAGTVEAVSLLVVDAVHDEAAMQRIPGAAFVGM